MKNNIYIYGMLVVLLLMVGGVDAKLDPKTGGTEYIAVMDLKVGKGIDPDLTTPLTNVVINELVGMNKFTVIDRANRDKILSEVGFQMTGCVDSSCTVEAGRILGVSKIIVGSVDMFGNTYLTNLQLINVQTAAIEASSSDKCKCDLDQVIDSVRIAARKLFGIQTSPETSTPTLPAATTAPRFGIAFVAATPEQQKSCPENMVYVPAGEFMMGCNQEDDPECPTEELPFHKVNLTAFCIDKYEVTVEQYASCFGAGKCTEPDKLFGVRACNWGKPDRKNHPMNCVDWNQATEYCKAQGKQLPTEAQWEKAARGTDARMYPWGKESPTCDYAIMDANGTGCGKDSTWPVGSKPKGVSPYGAYDMAGNVWEWTLDWYAQTYFSNSPSANPTGPATGKDKVLKGGGWPYQSTSLRTTRRHVSSPVKGSDRRGVRCASVPLNP